MKKIKLKKTKKLNDEEQLALVYMRKGDLLQAEAIYKNILRSQPDHFDALHMLGVIYYQLANFELAIKYINNALQYNPSHADAYYNLGNAYTGKKQFDEAITCYRKAVQYDPNIVEAYDNLGHAYMETKHFNEAVICYQKVTELNPNSDTAYINLGDAFQEKGQFNEAMTCYQKSLKLNSTNADTYNKLGVSLQLKGQVDEAIACYQEAIKLNPNFDTAYSNLGNVFQEIGKFDKAMVHYQKSLQLDSNRVDAHLNMSLILLLSGSFKEGWKEYEWRKKLKDFYQPIFSQPMWDGSDITGQTILLHAEQGFGDTIQFIRYAPLVANRGAKVIVECLKEIKSLLQTVKGIHRVIVRGEKLPEFNTHCSLLSLPLVFNTTLDNIPVKVPYVTIDPLLLEKWRDKVCSDRSHFKIGLVWSGNPRHVDERKRSCTLEIFSSLSLLNDVTFYSLQKGEAAEQTKNPPDGMKLIDCTGDIHNFSDTAALIDNLDLVISVDTAVAHLAGALGKPVWTLLPFVPDWRWMLNRTDSPWYPTMKLFRQPSLGDWELVILKVKDELLELLG
jgi:tetratricopeptide (TPR) repeat protein